MAKTKTKYRPGDEVLWNDPDNGISSGIYKVVSIKQVSDDPIYVISNGSTTTEVFESELS